MARDKATRRVTGASSHVSTAPLSDFFAPLSPEEQRRYAEDIRLSEEDERRGWEEAMTSDEIIGGIGAAASSQVVQERPLEFTPDALSPGIS